MDNEQIETIGIWLLRLLLVSGAIVAGLMGKEDICSGLAMAAVFSFILI